MCPPRRPPGPMRGLPGAAVICQDALPYGAVPMFAAFAARTDADDPLSGLELGERPEPSAPDGWTTVTVRAGSLNHHDVWSLRGVGLPQDRLPMILGCDAAGIDADGNEVIVHGVVSDPSWRDDETLDD